VDSQLRALRVLAVWGSGFALPFPAIAVWGAGAADPAQRGVEMGVLFATLVVLSVLAVLCGSSDGRFSSCREAKALCNDTAALLAHFQLSCTILGLACGLAIFWAVEGPEERLKLDVALACHAVSHMLAAGRACWDLYGKLQKEASDRAKSIEAVSRFVFHDAPKHLQRAQVQTIPLTNDHLSTAAKILASAKGVPQSVKNQVIPHLVRAQEGMHCIEEGAGASKA
jgi:hypothetical protein